MRTGIYISNFTSTLGGGEYEVALLAEGLRDQSHVEIIHHKADISAQDFQRFFDVDLNGVGFRSLPRDLHRYGNARTPWGRYREERSWQAEISEGYDLFVNFTHRIPPFNRAPRGALRVFFPFEGPPNYWPWSENNGHGIWRRVRACYYDWEWQQRMQSYHCFLANSAFTAQWTRRYWGADCDVVYPPADLTYTCAAKSNLVLNVGRICALKKQRELIDAFRQMHSRSLPGWRFVCAGALDQSPAEQQYSKLLHEQTIGCPCQILTSISRAHLRSLYGEAKILWHAMGYGEDEQRAPGNCEHFGIVTVEAMAAGCVPVVINKGGQREIVEHGRSGFLWNTLDELEEYTVRLARDEALRRRMAEESRRRAQRFSRENFVRRSTEILQPCGAAEE